MNTLRRIISFTAILGLLVPFALFASGGNIDPAQSTVRLCGSSADCSSFTPVSWVTTHGSVTVSDTALGGDIWSSDLGWITLDPTSMTTGVHNTTDGTVSGYGWGAGAGWVNFNPTHGGVHIDPTTGIFSGWAWVQNSGWMDFNCDFSSGACLATTWRPGTSSGGGGSGGGGGGSSGGGGGGVIISGGGTTGTGDTGGNPGDTGGDTGGNTQPGDNGNGNTDNGNPGNNSGNNGGNDASNGGDTGGNGGSDSGSNGGNSGGTGGAIGSIVQTVFPGWTNVCDPSNGSGAVGQVVGQVRASYCQTVDKINLARAAIQKILNTGTASTVTKVVAATGIVAGASAAIVSALFLNPLSFSEIFLIPARLWSLLMAALGIKKRRRPWGTVYDSITKQPLDPAYVTLRTLEGVDVVSSLTDLDGRFGFVVPEPGTYSIVAQKTNYLFPSQKLVGRDHDEMYRDLYFGEHFVVANAGDVVIKNIPMDPEHFDWNEFAKKQQKLMRFYSKRDRVLGHVSDVLFAAGFTVALVAVIAAPKPYNLVTIALYVGLYFFRRYGKHSRPYGDVSDAKTGDPLSFALIRISSVSTGVEVMHRIADARGRYYALLPNAQYIVRIDRKMPDESYALAAENLPVTVTKGYLSNKFEV